MAEEQVTVVMGVGVDGEVETDLVFPRNPKGCSDLKDDKEARMGAEGGEGSEQTQEGGESFREMPGEKAVSTVSRSVV